MIVEEPKRTPMPQHQVLTEQGAQAPERPDVQPSERRDGELHPNTAQRDNR